jgi:hypothetical protein
LLPNTPHILELLAAHGSVLIDQAGDEIEAFAYGDRTADQPIVFGVGTTVPEAMAALEHQLNLRASDGRQPTTPDVTEREA